MVTHPLNRVNNIQAVALPALAVFVSCLIPMLLTLPNPESGGVVDLVAAGSVQVANEIIQSWSQDEKLRALHAVGLDYLMNPAYMLVLCSGVLWALRRYTSNIVKSTGAMIGWGMVLASILNIGENIGIFVTLTQNSVTPWPWIMLLAHYFAGTVVILGISYVFVSLFARQNAT